MRSILYCLKLSPTLQKLYLVFYIIKLTTIFKNPIPRRHSKLPPDSVIINREEEWEVECYELKLLGLSNRTTLVLSNTRELNRELFYKLVYLYSSTGGPC